MIPPRLRRFLPGLCGLLLFLAAACGGREAQRRFDEAMKLFDAGDYLAAAHAFELVVVDHPRAKTADRSLFMAGQIYGLYLDQFDRSLDAYQRLVKDYPDSEYASRALLGRAEIYHYKYENYSRAILEYHRLLVRDPAFPQADQIHFRMARCFLELRNFDDSRAVLELILKQYPQSDWADDAALGLAESYYLQGRPETALSIYREFIRAYPQSPLLIQARFGVAKSLEESLRLDEAIAAYQALLKDYPNPGLIQERLTAVEKRFQERNR